MTHEIIGVLFRGFERLIVVSAAFVAIWLGYRLFDKVVSDRGAFEGKIGEWKVKLQRIAPGVLFAFFGAGVLIFSLNSPLSFGHPAPRQQAAAGQQAANEEQTSQSNKDESSFHYEQAQTPKAPEIRQHELFSAISSSVVLLSNPDVINRLEDNEKTLAAIAVPPLMRQRDAMIDQLYGPGWREKYYDISQKMSKDNGYLNTVSPEDARTFKAIQGAMTMK